VIKPSEFAPLAVLRMCSLIKDTGFPPGVVNVVGFGSTIARAISEHMEVDKVAFTGSTTFVGRTIMEAAATRRSNVLHLN
jgi:aldehyde dehydrogenase (NAD+)